MKCMQQYLVLSEVYVKVFCPSGVTCCTDGDEIWRGGVDQRFYPNHFTGAGVGSKTEKFKQIFTKFWNIYASHWHTLCPIFTKFSVIVDFSAGSCVTVLGDSVKGFQRYGGLYLRMSGYP